MKRIFGLLVVLGVLSITVAGLVACARPQPTVTPAPTSTPTSMPTPSITPLPTATPLPPQPPRVLRRSPQRGEELPPNAPVLIYFDQEMDARSLEEALVIEPAVKGSLSWDDPRTLRLNPPAEGFARNTEYRITISTKARSSRKLALMQPVEFRFRTVGYLEVTEVFPLPDSVGVSDESVIRVVFNRPVVPLTAIQDQAGLPEPLEFTPPIKGKGNWTNTSIYTFTPSERLLPGTRYKAVVRQGLQDTTGGLLAQDYVWFFTTALPDVVSVSPAHKALYVSPGASVRIHFNQPMDHEATQARFSLKHSQTQQAVAGSFRWDGTSMIFTPARPLELGIQYLARLEKGSPAASGQATVANTYAWAFTVVDQPELITSSPREGETGVNLGGGLQFVFSSPISEPTFLKGLIITPTAKVYVYLEKDDTVVHVGTYLRPSTLYTVTLTTDVQGRYGHPLKESKTIRFRTRPLEPMVQLSFYGAGVFSAYSKPVIYGSFLNVSRVNMALYTLPVEDFIALNGEDSWKFWEEYRGKEEHLVRRWSRAVSAPLNTSKPFSQTLTLPDGEALPSGLYYLEVGAPEMRSVEKRLLVVSDTNLTLKSTPTEVLVWATDMRDALPIPGVSLTVYNGKGQLLAEAKTDQDGVARAEIPQQEPWAPLIVLARRGDGVTAVLRNWSSGLDPWDFGLEGGFSLERYNGFLYTDRRIYRPGQKVYFKGILRLDDDAQYSLPPAGGEVHVVVNDGQGRQIWQDVFSLSEMGTFYGEFELGQDAALGYYDLRAKYGEYYFGVDFQVAEYRKPEFQAQVTLDKTDYIHGDTIQAVAEASYFFGGPVSQAKVHWRVMSQPYFFDRWQGEGYYDFTDADDYWRPSFSAYGEVVTEGEGQTDAQGRFVFSVPANIAERRQSQIYTVEASIVDVNNQEVSARSAAVVHKGTFYIGLAPTSYVGTAGREASVHLITVDTQGVTRTHQALEVVFNLREWYSVQEKLGESGYYWTNKVRDTPVATKTVQTDELGQALVSFKPEKGGTYRIVARGLDERENEVRSATFLWISDREWVNWGQQNHDRIELVADKKSYRPGETAQILIPSPYQGKVKALLTLERGHILEHRLLDLESNSEQLYLPILPEYAPNVYVSVVIVKGVDETNPVATFKVGYVMLSVSTERKELQITITPDRIGFYKPRDKVTYAIEVKDYQGRGVEAELSLHLVDLAVESLTGADPRDIVQWFYRERGLGVSTASTLAVSVDRRDQEKAAMGKGGGGAEEGIVRQQFADTAFWAPVVRTDALGRASVTVELPDNLTTWRMRAQAITAQTEVGKAKADVIANLDLMVRPVVPRFMVIGDRPVLGAVVHNNTPQELEVVVSLEAEGVTVSNGRQSVRVPAGGRETVSWPAVVGAAERAKLRFRASGGQYSDAVELRLPIYHPSTPETVGTSGQVEEQVIELVRLPEVIDLSLGELKVILEPSLAAGMQEGLEFLRTYPYDCIEQTVSRFLPNVVTYRALKKLGIRNMELETELPRQVAVALQRIYALQNKDGGWGWWPNEESNPVLSAYVIFGLVEAQRARFSVDQGALGQGIAYLRGWLDQEESQAEYDARAIVLYTLAEAGQGDLGRAVNLFERRASMSLYARAYLAMALHILAPDESSRPSALVNELANAAILSASGAHWEEKRPDGWAMNTDIRTTAIILRALVRLRPESSLLANVVRWLMVARSSGRWETTQENVWSILALTDYMVASGELAADYTYGLWLNGVKQISGAVSSANVNKPVLMQWPVSALRLEGDNDLILERTTTGGQKGTGKLYYSAFLRYFVPAEQVRPLSRGIFVERQYYLANDPKKPISQATVNDVLTVKLTLIAPNDLYYLVLEDPLPAGCEAVDTSLKTTSAAARGPELEQKGEEETSAEELPWAGYRYWVSHTELRDERVALFASFLPKGTYEYTYSLRCTTPGQFKVMPATAYEMYFADVFGRSAGTVFTIAAGQ